MLVAAGFALFRAWRFRHALGPGLTIPSDPATAPEQASHRRAGTIAKWSGLLAFLTACGVWAGMLLRA
jgi:hypothetical protein